MDARQSFVRSINGITFIDAIALEEAIAADVPVHSRLREKMILAGAAFWNEARTIVKNPVVAISAIGGFSVRFDANTPAGMIQLGSKGQPQKVEHIIDDLRENMGLQSTHTYMNPNSKTPRQLYDTTVSHQHLSILHSVQIQFHILGLSLTAEHEFDTQRDHFYLARETSARCQAQDNPTLFALTERGARAAEDLLLQTKKRLVEFTQQDGGSAADWREERNALFPRTTCVSLGISGTLANLFKVMAALEDGGKELEYRKNLGLINDSLHGMFPEVFKPTSDYQQKLTVKGTGMFIEIPLKRSILLLGAPGVGKTTQTELIKKAIPGVMCVSTGNLLRKVSAKMKEGRVLTGVEQNVARSLDEMESGKIVNDDRSVYELLFAHLSPGGEGYQEYQKSHTIILDGVIKERKNIGTFNALLYKFNSRTYFPMRMLEVVNITAPRESLISRQQQRVQQATEQGLPQRADDMKYEERVATYYSNVGEVLNFYLENSAYPVTSVDGSQSIEATSSALINIIKPADASLTIGARK